MPVVTKTLRVNIADYLYSTGHSGYLPNVKFRVAETAADSVGTAINTAVKGVSDGVSKGADYLVTKQIAAPVAGAADNTAQRAEKLRLTFETNPVTADNYPGGEEFKATIPVVNSANLGVGNLLDLTAGKGKALKDALDGKVYDETGFPGTLVEARYVSG